MSAVVCGRGDALPARNAPQTNAGQRLLITNRRSHPATDRTPFRSGLFRLVQVPPCAASLECRRMPPRTNCGHQDRPQMLRAPKIVTPTEPVRSAWLPRGSVSCCRISPGGCRGKLSLPFLSAQFFSSSTGLVPIDGTSFQWNSISRRARAVRVAAR